MGVESGIQLINLSTEQEVDITSNRHNTAKVADEEIQGDLNSSDTACVWTSIQHITNYKCSRDPSTAAVHLRLRDLTLSLPDLRMNHVDLSQLEPADSSLTLQRQKVK